MRPIYFVVSLIVLVAAIAPAQSVRGSIAGIVTDASRKPLDGAAVTLTEEATNKKRPAITDSRGEFLVSAVLPGSYQLEVEHAGYRKYAQRLTLALDQELRVDVP